MQALENEIKQLIIHSLNLEELSIDEIDTDMPLFNEGLGLDSIDALELGLAIKNKFKVQLNAENEAVHQHFYSVKTLADFIRSQTEV
ncbi:phosphopantetheine-binding protein [Pasteurella sp. PK-2025]|uniref:phosphopantetheine-binding protein n=1 Tax=unclassified Pasteurella TaxID=2621516 RepID=UPI003C748E52